MSENNIVPTNHIEHSILLIRGQRVMLDSVLAQMYGVMTGRLNEAVKRNILRFPKDFMFQLTEQEVEVLRFQIGTSNLISQIAISSSGKYGGIRKLPYVFTEFGVAMLSSVLRSERAIAVNIEIIRTFTKLRQMLMEHKDLARRLEEYEKRNDKKFAVVFDTLRKLMTPPPTPPEPKKGKIGFNTEGK